RAGDGEGTSAQGGVRGREVVAEVVWEVEVEEEKVANLEGAFVGYLVEDKDVQALKNNFRMSGAL
ncbi:hypothetical protein A2U01_0083610, partial [Trifolium medium]|nr:hypothetical protein [Trifolium medium]